MDKRTLLIYAGFVILLGALISAVFFLLYTGISYTMPVTDAQRFRFAFWNTVVITGVILLIMFWKNIRDFLDRFNPVEGEDDEAE
jgi:hypothetical protein